MSAGAGGATLATGGNAVNTYAGNTIFSLCSAGRVVLGVSNALPVATNVLFGVLTGGTTGVSPNQIPIGSGGKFDLSGFNQQVASLSSGAYAAFPASGTNSVIVNSSPTDDSVLTVSGSVTPVSAFSGTIIDTNGNTILLDSSSTVTGTVLTKTGAGVLTLAGTQTYATLNANAETTNVGSPLGTGTSAINVGAGAAANITVSETLSSLTIGAGATVTFGDGLPFTGDPGKFALAVPEPSTLGLALSALGVPGCRRRRGATVK